MSIELTTLPKEEIFRSELSDFIKPTQSFAEWLTGFPKVVYDLNDLVYGKGTLYICGSSSDLERMAASPEFLVEFHEMLIRTFNTIHIEYKFVD